MSSLLICRMGQEDSIVGNIALARAMAKQNHEVTLVFAGDALVALHTGTVEWSPNFLHRDARAAVIAAAERHGLPLADQARDARWSDVRSLARWASELEGVRIVACPLWQQLLDAGDLPDYLEKITETELVNLLEQADTIVGAY